MAPSFYKVDEMVSFDTRYQTEDNYAFRSLVMRKFDPRNLPFGDDFDDDGEEDHLGSGPEDEDEEKVCYDGTALSIYMGTPGCLPPDAIGHFNLSQEHAVLVGQNSNGKRQRLDCEALSTLLSCHITTGIGCGPVIRELFLVNWHIVPTIRAPKYKHRETEGIIINRLVLRRVEIEVDQTGQSGLAQLLQLSSVKRVDELVILDNVAPSKGFTKLDFCDAERLVQNAAQSSPACAVVRHVGMQATSASSLLLLMLASPQMCTGLRSLQVTLCTWDDLLAFQVLMHARYSQEPKSKLTTVAVDTTPFFADWENNECKLATRVWELAPLLRVDEFIASTHVHALDCPLTAPKQLHDTQRPFPTCANTESWLSLCDQIQEARKAGASRIDIEFASACTARHCATSDQLAGFLRAVDWERLWEALQAPVGEAIAHEHPGETSLRRLGFSARGRELDGEERGLLQQVVLRMAERYSSVLPAYLPVPSFTHDLGRYEFEVYPYVH